MRRDCAFRSVEMPGQVFSAPISKVEIFPPRHHLSYVFIKVTATADVRPSRAAPQRPHPGMLGPLPPSHLRRSRWSTLGGCPCRPSGGVVRSTCPLKSSPPIGHFSGWRAVMESFYSGAPRAPACDAWPMARITPEFGAPACFLIHAVPKSAWRTDVSFASSSLVSADVQLHMRPASRVALPSLRQGRHLANMFPRRPRTAITATALALLALAPPVPWRWPSTSATPARA